MRTMMIYAILVLGVLSLNSCVASKKIEKTPIETFVMPCSEMVSGNGVLRAWASGKSDSEMSARKKAQMAAAADLAATLERIVEALIEDKSVIMSNADQGISKSFFSEKATLTVKQSLKGVAIVCDRWVKDEVTGQYTNYLVMELRGDEYLKLLYNEIDKDGKTAIDKRKLEEQLFKLINESAQ
jgi:hypothetical protein